MYHLSKKEQVEAFTKAMGQAFNQTPSRDVAELRQKLIMEEAAEVFDELDREVINKVALTKELADLLYVVYGTAVAFGLPIDPAFNRVHKSNMSKLDTDYKPIKDEDGKVLKGPYYKPPHLDDLFN